MFFYLKRVFHRGSAKRGDESEVVFDRGGFQGGTASTGGTPIFSLRATRAEKNHIIMTFSSNLR